MKPFKIILAIVFSLLLGVSNSVAQNNTDQLNLSKEQKKLLKAQTQLIKKNRIAFKATLTSEQLAILKNNALSKIERQQALKASLNSTQKRLIAQNNTSVKNAKQEFRATLTRAQRQQLKKRFKGARGSAKKNSIKSIRNKVKKNRGN